MSGTKVFRFALVRVGARLKTPAFVKSRADIMARVLSFSARRIGFSQRREGAKETAEGLATEFTESIGDSFIIKLCGLCRRCAGDPVGSRLFWFVSWGV